VSRPPRGPPAHSRAAKSGGRPRVAPRTRNWKPTSSSRRGLDQRLALRGIDVELPGNILEAFDQMLRRFVAIQSRQRFVGGDESAFRRRLEHASIALSKIDRYFASESRNSRTVLPGVAWPPPGPFAPAARASATKRQRRPATTPAPADSTRSTRSCEEPPAAAVVTLHCTPQRRPHQDYEYHQQRGTFPVFGGRGRSVGHFGHAEVRAGDTQVCTLARCVLLHEQFPPVHQPISSTPRAAFLRFAYAIRRRPPTFRNCRHPPPSAT